MPISAPLGALTEKGMRSYSNKRISEWSVEDRPREKLLNDGVQVLSNAEIIALLIGSGTRERNALEIARIMLAESDNSLHELFRKSIHDLTAIPGIGNARAVTLMAAFELGRRKNCFKSLPPTFIRNSDSAYQILMPRLSSLEHEEFWIIILNRAHRVSGVQKISQGGLTGTVIDTRLILKNVLDKKGTSLIIAHNHPSGNLSPSEADRSITKKIGEAAKTMDIHLLDHLILTASSYFSFADEGIL